MDSIFSLPRHEYRQAKLAFRRGLIKNSLTIVQRNLFNDRTAKNEDLPFCLLSIQCHLSLGDFSRALYQAQQAVTRFPNESKALFLLAKAMEKHGRNLIPQALECYRKVALNQPGHVLSLKGIVRILCREQKFREAQEFQRQLVQIKPDSPLFLSQLARITRKVGNHSESMNLIRQGRFLFPDSDWFSLHYRKLGGKTNQRTNSRKGPKFLHFFNLRSSKRSTTTQKNEIVVFRLIDSPRFNWKRGSSVKDRLTPG